MPARIANRSTAEIVALGAQLLTGTGRVSRCAKAARIGVDKGQAAEYARVAAVFGARIGDRSLEIDLAALVVLSAPDVPEGVRDLAVAYAERGARITKRLAEAMIMAGVGE